MLHVHSCSYFLVGNKDGDGADHLILNNLQRHLGARVNTLACVCLTPRGDVCVVLDRNETVVEGEEFLVDNETQAVPLADRSICADLHNPGPFSPARNTDPDLDPMAAWASDSGAGDRMKAMFLGHRIIYHT